MKKVFVVIAAAITVALALATGVRADNGATVTHATLASSIFDGTTLYPMTCEETQVINGNQRKETFQCTFDAAAPTPFVCDTSNGCFWFSDFDGAEATSTHFVITPSGRVLGWAVY
ncbi:MAG TPA: hypothetical protein VF232_09295 [Gaiellaceae bacterium]